MFFFNRFVWVWGFIVISRDFLRSSLLFFPGFLGFRDLFFFVLEFFSRGFLEVL